MKFSLDELLSHRLLIVSGKGGVGKTTVSLALGLLAAERQKKVLLAEINSEEQVAHLLERPPIGYQETDLLPGLRGINVLPKKSFEEYVLKQLRFRSLYRAVFENLLVRRFLDATPGLADLMAIGKVYSLVQDYDLVVVDAPATGHGIALLEIPSVVSRTVRVGPLKTEAAKIDRLLHDPEKTCVVLVTLPEEMPVTETIELRGLLEEKLLLPVGPLFLNQVQTLPFHRKEMEELLRFRKGRGVEDPLWKRIELKISRAELSQGYRRRLEESLAEKPLLPLPMIFSPSFGLTEIQRIAAEMENP